MAYYDDITELTKELSGDYRKHISKKQTWSQYKKIYGLENIKNNAFAIARLQTEWIRMQVNNRTDIVNKINTEINAQINPDFSTEIEKLVGQNLEKSFFNLKQRFEDAKKTSNEDFNTTLEKIIKEYQVLVNKIGSIQNNQGQIDYKSLSTIEKSIFKLENDIVVLKQFLNKYPSGATYEQLARAKIGYSKTTTPQLMNKTSKKSGAVNILKQLQGIGSAIKGLELELAATEILGKHLPNLNTNNTTSEVVNTGNIRVQIGGSKLSTNIKEDISLFNTALNTTIELIDGKKISLEELIARNKNGVTVTVSQPGYEQLQKAMITAFSAKSSKSKNIMLHSGLTLNNLLDRVEDKDSKYYALKHILQLYQWNNNMRGNIDYNKALVNYNLSKILDQIIGKKNDFIITNSGIQLMSDYISDMIKIGRYIRVSSFSYTKGMDVVL